MLRSREITTKSGGQRGFLSPEVVPSFFLLRGFRPKIRGVALWVFFRFSNGQLIEGVFDNIVLWYFNSEARDLIRWIKWVCMRRSR